MWLEQYSMKKRWRGVVRTGVVVRLDDGWCGVE